MNEDKIYSIRKVLVMLTCILTFVTLGLVVINFQSKTVKIDYYGEVLEINTMSNTVEGLLMQNKIFIDEKAVVYPSVDNRLKDNMEIKIYSEQVEAKLDINEYIEKSKNQITEKKVEEIRIIPFEEQEKATNKLTRGQTNVVQQGADGAVKQLYIIKYNSDTEVARTLLNEVVEKAALGQIKEVGTAVPNVSRGHVSVDNGFKTYNIKLPEEQQKYAYTMSQAYGVQYELFLAVMYKESGFNPNSVGGGNSYGLSQIHISNHGNLRRVLGVSNFLDPYDNIKAGAYMLSRYFGSARTKVSDPWEVEVYALNCYNMGEGSYFNNCYSKGQLTRSYSNSIQSIRDRLIANGGL